MGLCQILKLLCEEHINTEWKKIFANHLSDKGLKSRVKNSYKATTKNPIKKWAKDLRKHFSKEI